jgi:hypothetical protein
MKNLNTHPVSEVNKKATHILFTQMGIVDTFKYLNQFTLGHGDYTKEREAWLKDLSFDDIVSGVKEQRNKKV